MYDSPAQYQNILEALAPYAPQKHYSLFISHSWDYGPDRDTLSQLIVGSLLPNETASDASAPKDHPIHTMSDMQLVNELVNRIKQIGVMVVPAGVYVTHSKWIQIEMAIAKELKVPIIAVEKWGANRSSLVATQGATETVGWNGSSVMGAIRRHHA